jgi:hypothetical protein
MRASMIRVLTRAPLAIAVLLLALAATGCGDEIGDSCSISSDCSPDGNRTCDTSSLDGYCTIVGCDFESCPDESTCVAFYGVFENTTCDPTTEDKPESRTDACSIDEICTLQGKCASRSSEVRYCMKTCSSNSDCRDGYECRDTDKDASDGGEPVRAPGSTSSRPKFCAQAPI